MGLSIDGVKVDQFGVQLPEPAIPFPPPDEDAPELPDVITLAAIVAAPIWASVWALTLGRMGKPLWRSDPRAAALGRFRMGYNLTSEPSCIEVPPTAQFGPVHPEVKRAARYGYTTSDARPAMPPTPPPLKELREGQIPTRPPPRPHPSDRPSGSVPG